MFVPGRTLGLAAALAGVTAGLVLGLRLHAGDDVRLPGAAPADASQAADRTAAEPARLPQAVTPIGSGPNADPLSIVARAHTIVLAAGGDDELPAAHLALRLRAPLLLAASPRASEAPTGTSEAPARPVAGTADRLVATMERLGVVRAIVVGPDAVERIARLGGARDIVRLRAGGGHGGRTRAVIRAAASASAGPHPTDVGFDRTRVEALLASAPPVASATRTAVLVRPRDERALPLVLAARAVGHAVVTTRAQDLRADPTVIDRLAELAAHGRPPRIVLGGAMAAIDAQTVAAHVATVATGTQLPGGGQLVIDPRRPHARRYVALYGTPQSPVLGALGEQSVSGSVSRVQRLARRYRRVTADRIEIVPCFEIIATVASASAGRDGNYSHEAPIAELRPAVDAARKAGVYVLLDIQPGRTDFLSQARRYRKLLREPHVGLALDPEWRLRPNQRHLRQIGSVGVDEVNEVAGWLANLVRRNRLPQKMLLIHQFRLSMVRNRHRMDTSRDELAYVVQMDGQGPQSTKLDTWRAVTSDPPDGMRFGWKNFYDEDPVVRTPARTMALRPPPVFVSYQ